MTSRVSSVVVSHLAGVPPYLSATAAATIFSTWSRLLTSQATEIA